MNIKELTDKTITAQWIEVAPVSKFPQNAGRCFKHGDLQIAIFNYTRKDKWFACQNLCPHKQEMVLSRGMLGDTDGIPKVACPLHKKTFSLVDGHNLNDDLGPITTYEVKVESGLVYVKI